MRIGYSDEYIGEIKSHPFFSDIDWTMLLNKKIEPPWKPHLIDRFDLRNIDPEFTQENISGSIYINDSSSNSNNKDNTFDGFSYEPDSILNNYPSLKSANT